MRPSLLASGAFVIFVWLERKSPDKFQDARIGGRVDQTGIGLIGSYPGVDTAEAGVIGKVERFSAKLKVNPV